MSRKKPNPNEVSWGELYRLVTELGDADPYGTRDMLLARKRQLKDPRRDERLRRLGVVVPRKSNARPDHGAAVRR